MSPGEKRICILSLKNRYCCWKQDEQHANATFLYSSSGGGGGGVVGGVWGGGVGGKEMFTASIISWSVFIIFSIGFLLGGLFIVKKLIALIVAFMSLGFIALNSTVGCVICSGADGDAGICGGGGIGGGGVGLIGGKGLNTATVCIYAFIFVVSSGRHGFRTKTSLKSSVCVIGCVAGGGGDCTWCLLGSMSTQYLLLRATPSV